MSTGKAIAVGINWALGILFAGSVAVMLFQRGTIANQRSTIDAHTKRLEAETRLREQAEDEAAYLRVAIDSLRRMGIEVIMPKDDKGERIPATNLPLN